MGEGTLGEVLECLDNEKKEVVAIKIVRSTQKYWEAAMIEINVLEKLARHDVCGILVCKFGIGLTIVTIFVLFLRSLVRANTIFYTKTAIVPFPLILFGSLAGNFWNLWHGEALFQTQENLEHLVMMERVLGPLPQHMMMRADRQFEIYIRRGAMLDWPEGATSRESMRAVWKLP